MDVIGNWVRSMPLVDFIDIAIVSSLIYVLLYGLRQVRSVEAVRGVLLVVVVSMALYFAAMTFKLTATLLLFERLWIVIVITLVMVFQNDIRKALQSFGQTWALPSAYGDTADPISEIIEAVKIMSRKKVGALICMERRVNVSNRFQGGTAIRIDALVTSELIQTIFGNYSALHDGGVVIRGNRILFAGALFPTATQAQVPKGRGSRHSAAMGATEENDSLAIVVSEETGEISISTNGKLEQRHTPETVRVALHQHLGVEGETTSDQGWSGKLFGVFRRKANLS